MPRSAGTVGPAGRGRVGVDAGGGEAWHTGGRGL